MESTQRIKPWGNGLGVLLPPHIAHAAGLHAGTQVSLTVEAGRITIARVAAPKLSLAEKLKAYDPDRHGGGCMVTGHVGAEVM